MILYELMMKAVRLQPRRDGNKSWLEYNGFIRFISWCGLVLIAFVCILTIRADEKQVKFMAKFLIVLLLFGIPAFIEAVFVQIGYDGQIIESRSGWRPRRTIPWDDLISYRWVESAQWWEVSTKSHGKLRVHCLLSGAKAFCAELDRRKVPLIGDP